LFSYFLSQDTNLGLDFPTSRAHFAQRHIAHSRQQRAFDRGSNQLHRRHTEYLTAYPLTNKLMCQSEAADAAGR
jgi:hypothetical protein